MTANKAPNFFRSFMLLAAITLLLQAELVFGDALDAMSEANAKRAATVLKAGNLLLQFCRTCNTFGMNNGELTVSKIISVEAAPRKELWYAKDLPYQVLVTTDLYFWATSVSVSKDKKEIKAIGNCMLPEKKPISDLGCYGFLGDDNEPHAARCTTAVSQNYSYFQRADLWANIATISQDDSEAIEWKDTIKLSGATWKKIESCRKMYEEGIPPPRKTRADRLKEYDDFFEIDKIINVCNPVVPASHKDFSLMNKIDPIGIIKGYLAEHDGHALGDIRNPSAMYEIDSPSHGEISIKYIDSYASQFYFPIEGYLGSDHVSFVTEVMGKTFKVSITLWVSDTAIGSCPADYKQQQPH